MKTGTRCLPRRPVAGTSGRASAEARAIARPRGPDANGATAAEFGARIAQAADRVGQLVLERGIEVQ